jgi:sugar phosphate isomerase/epimerase
MEEDCFLIKELIEQINNPNFSVCLDVGNVNTFSNNSIQKWIDVLGSDIKHMHIHNRTFTKYK